MNKMNPFSALTASYPLIFLSKLAIRDEIALIANCGKKILTRAAANFASDSLPDLPIALPIILVRNPPD